MRNDAIDVPPPVAFLPSRFALAALTMPPNYEPWPWQAQPRREPFDMVGAIDSVVDFGLARDEADLRQLTSLICAGLPQGEDCQATWTREGTDMVCLEVVGRTNVYYQRFERQTGGLVARQDLFVIDNNYHGGGHAIRLAKNLLILYRALGIYHVSACANYGNGGYTWAAFGAIPFNHRQQRAKLRQVIADRVRSGALSEHFAAAALAVIDKAHKVELMRAIAALEGDDGTEIGKLILAPHTWDAYWDFRNVSLRAYLTDILR